MKKIITTISLALGSVGVALAQVPAPVITTSSNASGQAIGQSVFNLLGLAQGVVNAMVPLLIGVGVLALFIGVIGFMTGKGAEEHTKWGKFLGYAILGLFVMVSIWGIVNFLGNIIGVGQGGGIPVPVVPGAR
jgi:hypothetical protein